MHSKSAQTHLFPKNELAYGGSLLTKRAARLKARPISTKHTMHLVLRSSKATNEWSFKHAKNRDKIRRIIARFAHKYSVQILNIANAGNHLHLHIRLGSRYGYKPFIRATTAAIAMAVTGINRWTVGDRKKIKNSKLIRSSNPEPQFKSKVLAPKTKFWDRRPFSRIIFGRRDFTNIKEYLRLNQIESMGFNRINARLFLAWKHDQNRLWQWSRGSPD